RHDQRWGIGEIWQCRKLEDFCNAVLEQKKARHEPEQTQDQRLIGRAKAIQGHRNSPPECPRVQSLNNRGGNWFTQVSRGWPGPAFVSCKSVVCNTRNRGGAVVFRLLLARKLARKKM